MSIPRAVTPSNEAPEKIVNLNLLTIFVEWKMLRAFGEVPMGDYGMIFGEILWYLQFLPKVILYINQQDI